LTFDPSVEERYWIITEQDFRAILAADAELKRLREVVSVLRSDLMKVTGITQEDAQAELRRVAEGEEVSRKEKCWMKRDNHPDYPLKKEQCCCKCSFLIPDYSHPCTDGKSISHRRGWICTIDLDRPGGFSGWSHHSIGCEMFTCRRAKEIK